MEDVKLVEVEVRHMERSIHSTEQLTLQGEAIEALEKTYGIWQSIINNKAALAYSMTYL